MIIRCKNCDFKYVSRRESLDELVREKVEHEYITNHKVVYVIALGSKLIEKEDAVNLWTCVCRHCWDIDNTRVVYSTISKLDADRFISMHNTNKAKKEKKSYEYHDFDIDATEFSRFVGEIKRKSAVIQRIIQDGINVADIDFKEKRMVTGDEELSFYLRESGAKDLETRIAYKIYKNSCPICYHDLITDGDYSRPDIDELLDKRFEIIFSHVNKLHGGDKDSNVVINLLQMCILYQRNLFDVKGTAFSDRTKKHDKKSQALRTLNKTGIPMSLLTVIFGLGSSNIGKLTYRGMEILGKPKWVDSVEHEAMQDV